MNNPRNHPAVDAAFQVWLTDPASREWSTLIRNADDTLPNSEVRRLSDLLRLRVSREKEKPRAEQLAEAHPFLAEQCETIGLPIERTDRYWTKTGDVSVLTVVEKEGFGKSIAEAVKDIIAESAIRPYEPVEVNPEREESLAAIISDMHVGLNPNPNRRAIYPVEYNPEIFNSNLNKVFNACKFNADYYGPVSLLSVSDLGDSADGWDKLTTRGGHELEQNLDNIGQFQTLVEGKLRLAENLIHSGIAKRYVFNSVTNDNHSGDLATIANMTVQMILERAYPKEVVSFRVMIKPLEHFTYGDHTFILMHGKDKNYQFKGLPLILDLKAEKYVRAYIDYHNIKSKYIHAWKGDTHQAAFSKCDSFDYRAFMSFAPPSQWVQNNFSGSYSGFAVQRIPKWSGAIQHTDHLLEFDRVTEPKDTNEYVY